MSLALRFSWFRKEELAELLEGLLVDDGITYEPVDNPDVFPDDQVRYRLVSEIRAEQALRKREVQS